MTHQCPHVDITFVVFERAVFVKCENCKVRNRLWLGGDAQNIFTLGDARALLDGKGGDARLNLKCQVNRCEKFAYPSSLFCLDHAVKNGESL